MSVPKVTCILSLLCISLFFPLSTSAKIDLTNAGDILRQTADENRTGLSQDDLSTASGKLIQRALGAVGIVFLCLMIYAGILWMSARGNEDQVTKARNTMIAGLIGIVVIVGAYAITNFILQRLESAARGSGGVGDQSGALGCCLDKVNAGWACRVTSENDCQRRGTLCEAGDDFCAANDYRFMADITDVQRCVQQCQNN